MPQILVIVKSQDATEWMPKIHSNSRNKHFGDPTKLLSLMQYHCNHVALRNNKEIGMDHQTIEHKRWLKMAFVAKILP